MLLDQTDGIPDEKVAERTPDLIVGLYSGLTDEQYATLSTIAPSSRSHPDRRTTASRWRSRASSA